MPHHRPGAGAHAAGRLGLARHAELVASLPIAGVDGTLRRSQSRSAAHPKPAACVT